LIRDIKILYLGYWGVEEILSVSTIYPPLRVLSEKVNEIVFVSIEREPRDSYVLPDMKKVRHHALEIEPFRNRFLNKIREFLFFPIKLYHLARREKFDGIICRTSLSSYYGLILNLLLGIELIVESYEPHNQYMVDAGVWRKNDLNDRFFRLYDKWVRKRARFLITVSINYRNELLRLGIDERKILLLPCTVDETHFSFDENARDRKRNELNIPNNSIVGVYVGKFGSLYHSIDDSFEIFVHSFKQLENFFLIILTKEDPEKLYLTAIQKGIDSKKIYIHYATHSEVPAFLSASDVAFALIKPTPSMKYSSPIKIGEYYANGIPIIIPPGIGDDSKLIEKYTRGVLSLDLRFDHLDLKEIIENNERNNQMALKFRSRKLVNRTYKIVLDSIQKSA
jgi:hypothetical protein